MLTLNDGRSELWQWDTGRTLSVDADCSQVHFSNKVFGRSIDVDVVDGAAIIPDILLQTDKDLNVWAFVGTAENGYTKISKTFKVNRRNKPADYVFTPPDQTTLAELSGRLDRIEESQDPDAIKNAVDDYLKQNPVEVPVQSVNGQTGAVELNAEDVGAIAKTELPTAINTALAQAKASGEFDGADGAPGKNGADGYSPTANVTHNDNGATITITDKNGTTTATITNGKDGADGSPGKDGVPGADGQDGITPTIGENGNWYLGDTDTGKPSRGADGATGATGATGEKGADGKSAYQYAVEGGYTGTEEDFAAKLAEELPGKLPNPNALTFTGAVTGSYDGSAPLSVDIPSSGGGQVFANVLLADGTIASGLSAWTAVDTGLTVGDLRKYKSFVILLTGSITGGLYYDFGTNIGTVKNAVRFEWEDDAKTILMCDGYSSYTNFFPDKYNSSIEHWGTNRPWARYDFRNIADSRSINFANISETTSEVTYQIMGWLK